MVLPLEYFFGLFSNFVLCEYRVNGKEHGNDYIVCWDARLDEGSGHVTDSVFHFGLRGCGAGRQDTHASMETLNIARAFCGWNSTAWMAGKDLRIKCGSSSTFNPKP